MNEYLLSYLWRSQSFDRGVLPRSGGGTVQLVFRGRPNPHDGPDFVDAIVALENGELLSGDVELHVRSGDWRAHGHQRDPRYNSVILHVVWQDDGSPILRQDGEPLPTAVLGGLPQSERWAAGAVSFMSPPRLDPCRKRYAALGPDALGQTLDRAGEERFLSKAAALEGELNCRAPQEVLYSGLMEALGYSRNRAPFRQLSLNLPLAVLCGYAAGKQEPRMIMTALLLGSAGLLPQAKDKPPTADAGNMPATRDAAVGQDYEDTVQQIWRWSGLEPLLSPSDWQRARVRPENLPVRRLAGMAGLLARTMETGLMEGMLSILRGAPTCDAQSGKRNAFGACSPLQDDVHKTSSARKSSLLRAFCQMPGEGYWSSHLEPGHPLTHPAPALIGAGRAAEMVVNVMLPFAWALGQQNGDDLLCQRAMDIYRRHAATQSNYVTRQMSEQFWGDQRMGLARSAQRHQGLLHLFHSYCRQRRCQDCPAARETVASAG